MITQDQCRRIEALGVGQEDHYLHKFTVNPTAWASEAVKLAERYTAKGQEVLDLGSGIPYFAHESKAEVTSLDDDIGIALEAARIIGVPYIVHRITADMILPEDLFGYDLVTMFGVNLRHGSPARSKTYWDAGEYSFLARDIRRRLKPGGRWILRPNQSEELSHLRSMAWWERVTRNEATVTLDGETVIGQEVVIQWPDP